MLSVLYPDSYEKKSLIKDTEYAQPALFALEYALTQMLKSWGIKPDAVMGHDVGEYTAACVAGIFTLEEGLALIAERGRLMSSLPQNGKMVAILSPISEVLARIKDYHDTVSVAATNSPMNTVISGDIAVIDEVLQQFKKDKIAYRDLRESHAFHSPLMEPILDEFKKTANGIKYTVPHLPILSNLTGNWTGNGSAINANYWTRHIRECVKFSDGMVKCIESGYTTYTEIGPNPALTKLAQNCLSSTTNGIQDIVLLNTLSKNHSNWETLTHAVANLFAEGYPVDWEGFDHGYTRKKVILPTYPFNRKILPPRGSVQQLRKRPDHNRLFDALVRTGRDETVSKADLSLLHRYHELNQKLNRVSLAYQCRALKSLGIFSPEETKISADILIEKGKILPRHRKLVQRWLDNLHIAKILDRVNETFSPTAAYSPTIKECANIESIAQDYRDTDISVFVDYVKLFGENLPGLLVGRSDPLALLFPSGSFEMAKKIYQGSVVARFCNGIVARIVKTFLESSCISKAESVKIIEIGAGTGGTTTSLIPICPSATTAYHFTDISELFINRAQKQFAHFGHVKYDLLNIEVDPISQGFQSMAFNVVVAANSLHATRNLNQTLKNVGNILAPGGILVLWESTEQLVWLDITFGLIDGWQRFEDSEIRPYHPLLNGEEWSRLLQTHGFSNVAVFPDADSLGIDISQRVIVAQRDVGGAKPSPKLAIPGKAHVVKESFKESITLNKELFYDVRWERKDLSQQPSERTNEAVKLWIIFADKGGMAGSLAQIIENQGDQTVCLYLGEQSGTEANNDIYFDPNNQEDIGNVLFNLVGDAITCGGIIHCWSLDCDQPGATNLNSIKTSLKYGCENIIHIIQAVTSNRTLFNEMDFWIVTRGAQYVPCHKGNISAGSTALWGLGRVISVEHPELKSRLIDLDPNDSKNAPALLIGELINSDMEEEIAYRDGKRYVPRLQRSDASLEKDNNELNCRPDATYLITGGMGGMGLLTARWLATRGSAAASPPDAARPTPKKRVEKHPR